MNDTIPLWIQSSLQCLFQGSDNILINSNLKEECINHRFALYLEMNKPEIFSEYYVDVEYDKNCSNEKYIIAHGQRKLIRPDIIIHKRNDNHEDNLIAFECKKKYLNKNDRDKLIALSVKGYNYKKCFGISYLPNRDYFRFYENGKDTGRNITKGDCKIWK